MKETLGLNVSYTYFSCRGIHWTVYMWLPLLIFLHFLSIQKNPLIYHYSRISSPTMLGHRRKCWICLNFEKKNWVFQGLIFQLMSYRFWHHLVFNPEEGGTMFLWNIVICLLDYMLLNQTDQSENLKQFNSVLKCFHSYTG